MEVRYDTLDHGGRGNDPKLIVVHSMGESIRDGDIYSARDFLDKLKLSAHVLVHPDGNLTVCRGDDQGAYHARGYNTDSLGIEILVPGIHDYGTFIDTIKRPSWCPKKAFSSAAEWVRGWMKIHGIDSRNVCRHSDLSPGRKLDPGAGFDWNKFKQAIAE